MWKKKSFLNRFALFLILILGCLSHSAYSQEKFTDITSYLPKNYDVTGKTDYTKYIQQAVNEKRNILLPNFPVLINDTGITLKSNTNIKFQRNSSFILAPSAKTNYDLIKIVNAENITLTNANLVGDRDRHLSSKGEWGMGITIRGGRNIKIVNATIKNFWGDGIYIARNKDVLSDNVSVTDSQFEYNRRNGISVISGRNITVKNCSFKNHRGINPMAAIDIEPNDKNDVVDGISLLNIDSQNNGKAVQIGLSRYPESKKNISINVSGMKSLNDDYGLVIGGYYEKYKTAAQLKGKINIEDVVVKSPKTKAVSLSRYYKYGPQYQFSKVQIINGNTQNYNDFKKDALERGLNVN